MEVGEPPAPRLEGVAQVVGEEGAELGKESGKVDAGLCDCADLVLPIIDVQYLLQF
jgi:hypothetical protein